MEFYARKTELSTLHELYAQKGLKGAIVYGRRRFGKTALIQESAKSFPGKVIYYQCLEAVDGENAKQLFLALRAVFPEVKLFGSYSFTDVLSLIFSLAKETPLLLILDEYPYLQQRETIDSFLQSLMDSHRQTDMKIVLSGSTVGVMEHLLDETHPLHGRFLYKIELGSFDYFDSASFYPDVSLVDKIRYYAVFGGVPYYLSMLDKSLPFEENVKRLILAPFAPLEEEIKTTLREEYSKISYASLVMSLIVEGKHSFSDINSVFRMQAPNADINYILKKLVDMGFVSKTYAINDGRKKSAYYGVEDNLLAFYYQVIFPQIGIKPLVSTEVFYQKFVEEKMNTQFIPHRFEKIAKEFLIRRNKAGKMDPIFTSIGSYTYNNPKLHQNGQFDLVTQDENGNTFYECKFTNEKIGKAVVEEEISQLKKAAVPYYRLGFFSKAGYDFNTNSQNLYFTLEDMF